MKNGNSLQRTTITAVGDVFLGDSPHLMGHGAGTCLDRSGWQKTAENIKGMLGEADIHFVNLETVISHAGRNVLSLSSVEMRGRPYGADFCRACGWNVANIANNHIFQHGQQAYEDTVSRLTAAGLSVVGDAEGQKSKACLTRKGSEELTWVGFSLRPEQYAVGMATPYANPLDHETVLSQVSEIVAQAPGPVVVSLHWGEEFMREPDAEQQRLARALCRAGVRLIIGHHPHVVQGVERVGDSLVAYSLGNFVFDLLDERSQESVVLRVALNGDGSTDYEMSPVLVGADCLPHLPDASRAEKMAREFAALSEKVQNGELDSHEKLVLQAKAYYGEFSRRNYKHFFSNLLRYNPLYSSQSIARGVLRKVGIVHDP